MQQETFFRNTLTVLLIGGLVWLAWFKGTLKG